MNNFNSLWDVLGAVIYLLPVILIVWKGGAMANEIKTMRSDIDKNKKDINDVGAKVDGQKDALASALRDITASVNALTNEVGKLSTKMDAFDERLDKLEERFDKLEARVNKA